MNSEPLQSKSVICPFVIKIMMIKNDKRRQEEWKKLMNEM